MLLRGMDWSQPTFSACETEFDKRMVAHISTTILTFCWGNTFSCDNILWRNSNRSRNGLRSYFVIIHVPILFTWSWEMTSSLIANTTMIKNLVRGEVDAVSISISSKASKTVIFPWIFIRCSSKSDQPLHRICRAKFHSQENSSLHGIGLGLKIE